MVPINSLINLPNDSYTVDFNNGTSEIEFKVGKRKFAYQVQKINDSYINLILEDKDTGDTGKYVKELFSYFEGTKIKYTVDDFNSMNVVNLVVNSDDQADPLINLPYVVPFSGLSFDSEKTGKITVKYKDTEGKTIAPDIIQNGSIGKAYSTDEQAIDGYTFKEIQGDATGKYTEADQTVTYVYTKDAVPAKQGKVTAKYVDTDGKTIAADKVLTGDVDTEYQTEKQAIAGYTFKEIQGNATGKYTQADQTVTYVYTKQDNSKPTPNEGGNKQNNTDKPGQSNSQNANDSNKQKQTSFGAKVQTGVKKLLPNTGAKQQVYLSVLGVVILGTVGHYVIKKRK